MTGALLSLILNQTPLITVIMKGIPLLEHTGKQLSISWKLVSSNSAAIESQFSPKVSFMTTSPVPQIFL